MSEFQQRFEELTHESTVVLDEDLAALQKLPDRDRIERYNSIKADEEEFVWEFSKEYDRLTDSEREDVRGDFRLARLLLAASFYDEGSVPRAMAEDFVDTELQAVLEFERYKRFDVLSEDEIEEKIRRMEGEVYELVTEYTSTQIANMDELMDDPDVQSDVMRKLLDRYQERREKIRQGFFVYVETHGLEHMVESIEAAVQAVSESANEREMIREEIQAEFESLSAEIESDIRSQQRTFEAELQRLERTVTSETVDRSEIRSEIDRLEEQREDISAEQVAMLEEFTRRIDRTSELEERLERKIEQLEQVKEDTKEQARASAREETTAVVEEELEALREQREQLRGEINSLERERQGIRVARDRLEKRQGDLEAEIDELAGERKGIEEARDELSETQQELDSEVDDLANEREGIEQASDELEDRQRDLESDVEDVRESLGAGETGLPENAVGTSLARLLEMDYIGRFDTSVYDATEVETPNGPFEVPTGYWDDRSEHLNERGRLDRLLPADGAPEEYPLNRRARYFVTSSKLLGLSRSREMVIEAATLSHLEAFVTNGFDASPADLDDLLSVVNTAVYEAQQNDYHYLLGVASPTGWTDRVIQQVNAGEIARTHYDRHLSLVLVDLSTGELIYDESDKTADRNRELYELPVDVERVDACVNVLRSHYVDEAGIDSVLLEEIVENEDFHVRVVREAFDRLEASGQGEQLQLEDFGLALDFS